MKKIQMLLLAVLIIGAASAFTTTATNDHYVLINGTYVLKSSAQGFCDDGEETCTFEIVDEPVAPIYTNPDNFMPLDFNQRWQQTAK